MRIGLLIYGDIQAISGGYLYNRKLIDYLHSRGDQVIVISLPPRNLWRQLADNLGKSCLQQIAAANIELLIEDAMVHPSVFLLNRKIDIPVVTLLHLLSSFDHHPWYSGWFYRTIEWRYLRSVSGLIANSLTTLAQASELLCDRLPPHCVAVPAGDHFPDTSVDADTIGRRSLTVGPLKILVVGNVIRRKGLHVLIRALCELPTEDFTVTVVGRLDMEPDYVRQLQDQIRTAQLLDSVILKGSLQGQSLVELYQQHQLMVLPSAYESYGIVYVEAQQFGLPVIGTTAGAAKEIIRHGDNGYLINPEDHQALAALLSALQADRQLLTQLSRNALAAYARHPRWEDSGEIIHQYLHRWNETRDISN